jgi:transcriptional regulator with XRE-family HTH domain
VISARQTFCMNLVNARHERGLRQRDIALRLSDRTGRETTPAMVSNWECGRALPDATYLRALISEIGLRAPGIWEVWGMAIHERAELMRKRAKERKNDVD